MEIPTKENLVGAKKLKNCSHRSFQDFHSLAKGNQVSSVRIHISHPESDGKSSDIGIGGRIGILICNFHKFYDPNICREGTILWRSENILKLCMRGLEKYTSVAELHTVMWATCQNQHPSYHFMLELCILRAIHHAP